MDGARWGGAGPSTTGAGNRALFRAEPNPSFRLTAAAFYDEAVGQAVLIGGDVYDPDRRFERWVADRRTYRHRER